MARKSKALDATTTEGGGGGGEEVEMTEENQDEQPKQTTTQKTKRPKVELPAAATPTMATSDIIDGSVEIPSSSISFHSLANNGAALTTLTTITEDSLTEPYVPAEYNGGTGEEEAMFASPPGVPRKRRTNTWLADESRLQNPQNHRPDRKKPTSKRTVRGTCVVCGNKNCSTCCGGCEAWMCCQGDESTNCYWKFHNLKDFKNYQS